MYQSILNRSCSNYWSGSTNLHIVKKGSYRIYNFPFVTQLTKQDAKPYKPKRYRVLKMSWTIKKYWYMRKTVMKRELDGLRKVIEIWYFWVLVGSMDFNKKGSCPTSMILWKVRFHENLRQFPYGVGTNQIYFLLDICNQ